MERCTCNLHPFSSNDTKKAMKLHAFVADNAEGRLTMRERLSLAEFAFRSCFERIRCLQRFCGKVAMLEKEIEKKRKRHTSYKINVSLLWIWISICIFRFGTFLKDVRSVRYNRLIGITSIFKELKVIV